jgi:HEAT repeat protein
MPCLKEEIGKFTAWGISTKHDAAEWETYYDHWQNLYNAVKQLLAADPDATLAADEIQDLLYVLARDNECETVLEILGKYPIIGLQLAKAATQSSDPDARWQAAVLLGRIRTQPAIELLKRFTEDTEEYVRVRARMALEGDE